MAFFPHLAGFLFAPLSEADQGRRSIRLRQAGGSKQVFFALYVSLLLGLSFWLFLFYPEPLYYGTPGAALVKEVPSNLFANPLSSLALSLAACVVIFFVYNFLILGRLSLAIMRRLAPRPDVGAGEYLGAYAYALAPLVFWVPLMALRSFFFERLLILKPLWPTFDLTPSNLGYLALAAVFILWRWWIELRINQALFRAPALLAAVPVAVEAALLAALLAGPSLLNGLIFNAMKDRLA